MYDKGKHLDWWQSLEAVERFEIMQKHGFTRVNDKIIFMLFERENEK